VPPNGPLEINFRLDHKTTRSVHLFMLLLGIDLVVRMNRWISHRLSQMIGVSLPWDLPLLLRLTLLSLSLPFVHLLHRLLQSRFLHPPVMLISLQFCCCYSFGNQCSQHDDDSHVLIPSCQSERSGTVIARNFWDVSG